MKTTTNFISDAFKILREIFGKKSQAFLKKLEEVENEIRTILLKNKPSLSTLEDYDLTVQKVLVGKGYVEEAKEYILRQKKIRDQNKQKELLGIKDELGFSLNSLVVIKNKYLKRDDKGNVSESTNEWLLRVSKALADAEEKEKDKKIWQKKFFQVMCDMQFFPAGRTLANAGTINGQLANCFVLPFEDNIEEIFEVVKESSILKKNGGGVGFSFSKIRPKGDHIATTTGAACGPVALMKVLDSTSEILLQAGGRRSGNMIVLSVSHPDVLEFISCKEQENVLNQINFSLGVTDGFMRAVEKDKMWELVNPRTGKSVQKIPAKSILEYAASSAWKKGDPGMIFLDRINRDNPTPHAGSIEAVNLCGEQPLLPYEACNLGSINLLKFLELKNGQYVFDLTDLEEVIRTAVRMLDNVITVCRYPVAKVDRVVKANRKIGLGVMGWADVLVKMQISYSSEKALKLAEKMMKFISDISHDESQKLGREKGSFTNFPGSSWQKKGYKYMRNSTCTTIAPTGSISMAAGVSSGIEPLFALVYYKQVMGGIRLPEINADLLMHLKKQEESLSFGKQSSEFFEKIEQEISRSGSIQNTTLPKEVKKIFATAMDLTYEDHIKMQAAFQKHTDNAVSKTINLSNNAGIEDVKKAFILAWKMGCKGITVYRDKSRGVQVLNVGKTNEDTMNESMVNAKNNPQFNPAVCPDCGGNLIKEEGCVNCRSCGFSACSL